MGEIVLITSNIILREYLKSFLDQHYEFVARVAEAFKVVLFRVLCEIFSILFRY